MARQYFGTDGIRGRVGVAPMTAEFALRLGWAAGRVLGGEPGARVVIGKDTRRSGYLFESALEAGLASAGVEVDLLGPLPTPAVAYLARVLGAQAGVVISASHNPHHDNGVKFFGPDGGKLSDALEEQIEAELQQPMGCVAPELLGRAKRVTDAPERYVEFCKTSFGQDSLRGMKLVLDCAHGAAYRVAPAIFRELGAELTVIGDQPDGFNINQDCGSTHLQTLCKVVQATGATAGIALDGDADRCLMVDASGQIVDGDRILFIIAQARLSAGSLQGPVVGTLMSNLGLEQALQGRGVEFLRAQVGDRHVLELLRSRGGLLGGETSGHTLCLDKTTTGDGCITALQVLGAMIQSGQSLQGLASGMTACPQILINVPVSGQAKQLLEHPEVRAAEARAGQELGSSGRVLLRASGTEPLLRIMVEAQDEQQTHRVAQHLAEVIRAASTGKGDNRGA
jgi:phosphoglucosamine mutase